jgi:chromosome partitioning protein
MSFEAESSAPPARIIVVANEKGGSGKSTIAMHIAVALMKAGRSVATIDLDSQQQTFSHYIENRRAWAARIGRELEIPNHMILDETTQDEWARRQALAAAVIALGRTCDFIVIDTPGYESSLTRAAHAIADTLVTPLNDSFVDLDVLATVDPETFQVTGPSRYARMVDEVRREREDNHYFTDWIVLRNRLTSINSHNKRLMGEALDELSRELNFRCADGLAERVIFRAFFPRGLTAIDDLNEKTHGTRLTMSHVTARLEIQNLIKAMDLGLDMPAAGEQGTAQALDAA